jgi:D-beta-D-heptose 7-phosphate kinase/D-beta-D-heptose 1-phosphate adenosyltransferase
LRNVDETVAVSGGFDCLHRGHVRMIQEASQFGEVVIILNSDAWLMRKKGYVFMPWEERKEILEAIKGVKKVVPVDDTDGTVCEALGREKPTYFANGGDRSDKNTPELTVCKDNNITMIWGIGGGKIQSSSELVSRLRKVS